MDLKSKDVRAEGVVTKQDQVLGLSDVCRDALNDLIKQSLSEQERLIIILCYSEKLTPAEIGQVLDLSEAQVSQIQTTVLSRLRAQLSWQGDSKVVRND